MRTFLVAIGFIFFLAANFAQAENPKRATRHADLTEPTRAKALVRYSEKENALPDRVNTCLIYSNGRGIVVGSGVGPFPEPKLFWLSETQRKELNEALTGLPKSLPEDRETLFPKSSPNFPLLAVAPDKDGTMRSFAADVKSPFKDTVEKFCPMKNFRATQAGTRKNDGKDRGVLVRYANAYRGDDKTIGVCFITRAGKGYVFVDRLPYFPFFHPFTLRPDSAYKNGLSEIKASDPVDKEDLSPDKVAPIIGAVPQEGTSPVVVLRDSELGRRVVQLCDIENPSK